MCDLTFQPGGEASLMGAMGGALFEGFMVSKALKILSIYGVGKSMFFWRSHDGIEIDLLLQIGGRLYPVEIKKTATPMPAHTRSLQKFKELAKDSVSDEGVLVCQVSSPTHLPFNNIAIPWQQFPNWLAEKLR